MALPDHTPRNIVYHDTCGFIDKNIPPQIHECVATINALILPARTFEELARYCDEHERKELIQTHARMTAEGRISDSAEIEGLAQILPDVVSTLRRFRRCINNHRRLGGCLDYTRAAVIFVETCLSVVDPDTFVLENVQFALSRPRYSFSDPLARFLPYYSRATFAFVPLGLGGSDDEEMGAPSPDNLSEESSPMSTSEASSSSSGHYPSDYGDTLEGWLEIHERRHQRLRYRTNRSLRSYVFTEDEASEDGRPDVEPPPETELLARSGSNKLCTMVVAPRNRLPQAMSSALYHRRAWGVSGPIAGLVFDRDSTVVEFAVGWLGDTLDPQYELPTVNIAWRMTDSCSSRGIHELKDVGSTLLVAAVILSLISKCDSERRVIDLGADSMIDEDLSWRTDTVTLPEECECRDEDDFISGWALATALLHIPATRRDTDTQQQEMPPKNKPPVKDMSTGSGRSAQARGTRTAGSEKVANTSRNATPKSSQLAVESNATASPAPSAKRMKTAASSTYSVIAGQAGSKDRAEPFWVWLRDRHVIAIVFPPQWLLSVIEHTNSVFHDRYIKIMPFVNCYNTYISVPPSCLDQLPRLVQAHPDPAVARFHETLATFQRSLASHVKGHTQEAWTDDLSKLLQNHCHDILRIAALAWRAKCMVDKSDALEIRFRKYFDLLLEIGLDNLEPGPEGAAVVTLYEKELQMPSNKLHAQTSLCSAALKGSRENATEALIYPMTYQRELLTEDSTTYEMIAEQFGDVIDPLEASRLASLAEFAKVWQSGQVVSDARNVHATEGINMDSLSSRSRAAPRTGKCDAVGVLKIPGVFPTLNDDIKAFQILRPPSSRPVNPGSTESYPTDGSSETQRLDIRDIGLGRPVDPALTNDIFASARSSRTCNILGQVDIVEDTLRPEITSARGLPTIQEDPTSPTSLSSEKNWSAARGNTTTSEQAIDDGGTDTNAETDQVMDSSHPAPALSSSADRTKDTVEAVDDFDDPREKDKGEFDLDTDSCDLYVPLIVVENKRKLDGYERKGGNQLRGYLTSGATYAEHLGVQNFQLFGMLTEEATASTQTATRTVARASSQIPKESTVTYIMERNACSFDISDPRDALNLVILLYKISRIHGPKLQEALKATCDKIRNGEMTPFPKWNQNQVHPPPPRESTKSEEPKDSKGSKKA